jgi:hypothetical protein
MKKLCAIAIIGLFLGVALLPVYTARNLEMDSVKYTSSISSNGWNFNNETGRWKIEFPAIPLNESIIITSERLIRTKTALAFMTNYSFADYYHYDEQTGNEYRYESHGYVEVSEDNKTWKTITEYIDKTPYDYKDIYLLHFQRYQNLYFRFTVIGEGDSYFSSDPGGNWSIWDIDVIGNTHGNPPISRVTFFSTNHWVNTVIEAYDKESWVKEIHYVDNGNETVVPGDHAGFRAPEYGNHKLSIWAIDSTNDEETPQIYYKYAYSYPEVKITFPTPGIYIFGKKVLDSDKLIMIGSFNISAECSEHSIVFTVRFYLDGQLINEDTEPPYKTYCGLRHIGTGEIRVVLEDFQMNFADDYLDIIYYNLF